jgi:hypothetical protein
MPKRINKCFECASDDFCVYHHVVPKSLGGTKTVPLCPICNAKVHSIKSINISDLTKRALAKKRKRGEITGGSVPYGYNLLDGHKLIKNDDEQAVIKLIVDLSESGYSLRKICRKLESLGYKTKIGNTTWAPSSIQSILYVFRRNQKELLND